jgi:hypothetical protein
MGGNDRVRSNMNTIRGIKGCYPSRLETAAESVRGQPRPRSGMVPRACSSLTYDRVVPGNGGRHA